MAVKCSYMQPLHAKDDSRRLPLAGANIIPLDIMPSRVTKEYMQQLVQSAKETHMNMLRVWGGGRYLPDEFYEACSEAGILIWQEAMFACAFYPRDAAFLMEASLSPLQPEHQAARQ